MKTSLILFFTCVGLLSVSALVVANPAMLPKHLGYPMGNAVDPVHGQSLANDPGLPNIVDQEALDKAAIVGDGHSKQNLPMNQDDHRLLEKPGAGLLPKVQGPNIKIQPLVKEGMKVNASPK